MRASDSGLTKISSSKICKFRLNDITKCSLQTANTEDVICI